MESIEKIPWSDLLMAKEIGNGASGRIYMGMLKTKNNVITVAIKKFYPVNKDGIVDENYFDAKEKLWHEATMMARLRHPNIISLHGIVCDDDEEDDPGIVMDYMCDCDLESVLLKDKDFEDLTWRQRVLIALQVASAMEYMHSMGIIHFDLKGPNVLLHRFFRLWKNGLWKSEFVMECKICDFGFAREKRDDMSFMQGYGTQDWKAPEMWEGTITEKVDVFSFGMLMYELLTGDRPSPYYSEKDEKIVIREPQRHPSVQQCSYWPWRAVMEECMAWDASRRPSFAEVGSKLKEISASLDSLEKDQG